MSLYQIFFTDILDGNFDNIRRQTSSRLRIFSSEATGIFRVVKRNTSLLVPVTTKKKRNVSSYRLTSSRPAGIYLLLPVGFVLTVHFKSRRGSKIDREELYVFTEPCLSNVCRPIKISRNVNASNLIDRGTFSPRSDLGIIISNARLSLARSLSLSGREVQINTLDGFSHQFPRSKAIARRTER